jgi:flagellar FliL protein
MAAAGAGAVAQAETPAVRGGPSLVIQLCLLIAMTLAAAGMGWFSGGFLNGGKSAADAHAPAAGGHGDEKAGSHGEAPAAGDTVIALPAITTNIGSPSDVWVRMEVSLVLDEPQPADLPNAVLQDLLAYIRTVKMHEVEGASGLRHLKENLEERAAIRSDGHVSQVLIRTLLFE